MNRRNLFGLAMLVSVSSFAQTSESLKEARSPWYTIVGDVERPGIYSLVAPMRVFDAIESAGGFRNWNPSNNDVVAIVREGKEIKFDWTEFREGRNLEQNVFLKNQDHVIVKPKRESKTNTLGAP